MSFFEEKSTFSGLIRYFARKLRDPHAEGELWSFLWLAMQAHPNKPDHYYAVCLRNEYIRLSKGEKCEILLADYWQGYYEECYEKIDLKIALAELSKRQADVIQLYFENGFSVVEIADFQHISRQAVNQTKKRALAELSNLLLDSTRLCG